jgi:hypothetical protein
LIALPASPRLVVYHFQYPRKFVTMRSICTVLLALSGASAFAPAQTARTSTKLAASEELVGLRGTGIESGGKIVSEVMCSSTVPVLQGRF